MSNHESKWPSLLAASALLIIDGIRPGDWSETYILAITRSLGESPPLLLYRSRLWVDSLSLDCIPAPFGCTANWICPLGMQPADAGNLQHCNNSSKYPIGLSAAKSGCSASSTWLAACVYKVPALNCELNMSLGVVSGFVLDQVE